MSQDVTQWLEEIKALRSQLATVQQERDEAFKESSTWRDRLNAEMQLRMRETTLLKQQIDTLEGDRVESEEEPSSAGVSDKLQGTLSQLTNLEDLRQFAIELAQERDRLRQELQSERQAHQSTRESLSIALGDTIDLLTQRPST